MQIPLGSKPASGTGKQRWFTWQFVTMLPPGSPLEGLSQHLPSTMHGHELLNLPEGSDPGFSHSMWTVGSHVRTHMDPLHVALVPCVLLGSAEDTSVNTH